jgi:hypothetical protein
MRSQAFIKLDYIKILQTEFINRKLVNPHYSLRTFAKDLRLKPNHLSYVLRRKKGLSKHNARTVAASLGYKEKEREIFRNLVRAQSARAKWDRMMARMWLRRNNIELAAQQDL